MSGSRIKVTLYNRTFKEIDMSDFSLKEADYGKNVTVAPDAFKGCINL